MEREPGGTGKDDGVRSVVGNHEAVEAQVRRAISVVGIRHRGLAPGVVTAIYELLEVRLSQGCIADAKGEVILLLPGPSSQQEQSMPRALRRGPGLRPRSAHVREAIVALS